MVLIYLGDVWFVLCYQMSGRFVSFLFVWFVGLHLQDKTAGLESPFARTKSAPKRIRSQSAMYVCVCVVTVVCGRKFLDDLLHAGLNRKIFLYRAHSENRAQDVPERANGGWGRKQRYGTGNERSVDLSTIQSLSIPLKGSKNTRDFW